ncbi:MAG: radical SAM protein [Spirochaetales bacterium]|nr:radical SAM protein [Spirochaetales bacterium]
MIKSWIQQKAFEQYKRMETDEHRLLYLFLEITRKCNLRCLHCGSDCKSSQQFPELTTDSWLKIVDYVAANFSKELIFVITGGEPLMSPDLEKIGAHIASTGRRWGMVTNGLALTPQRLQSLVDANVYSITISLDGLEDSHNFLRNSSKSFESVVNSLKILGSRDEIRFKEAVTCVYPKNLDELDQIAQLLIENKITHWRLFRIFPSGRAKTNDALRMSHQQTNRMLEWIASNRDKYRRQGLSLSASCEGYLPFKQDKKVRDFPFFCRAGINFGAILADGTITGCNNNHNTFYQGNIIKDNFLNVWNNRFEDYRQKESWLEGTYCQQSCKEYKSCMGGSVHLWEKGDDKPKFCYLHDFDSCKD